METRNMGWRPDIASDVPPRKTLDTPVTAFIRDVLIPKWESEDPGGLVSVSKRAGLSKNWCSQLKNGQIKGATIEAATSLARLEGWSFLRLTQEAFSWAERHRPELLGSSLPAKRPATPAPPRKSPSSAPPPSLTAEQLEELVAQNQEIISRLRALTATPKPPPTNTRIKLRKDK